MESSHSSGRNAYSLRILRHPRDGHSRSSSCATEVDLIDAFLSIGCAASDESCGSQVW